MNDYELYHYGVLGMKWGVRRARRKAAKGAYKEATDKAFKQYEKEIGRIEKPYKRGQNLSDKDVAREVAAEKKYNEAVARAKTEYKQNRNSKSNDAEIANRLYSKQSKEANARVTQMSTGKALAETFLMGSYGALKYNEARARGASKGRAVVESFLYEVADKMTYTALSTGKYLENRAARKKR